MPATYKLFIYIYFLVDSYPDWTEGLPLLALFLIILSLSVVCRLPSYLRYFSLTKTLLILLISKHPNIAVITINSNSINPKALTLRTFRLVQKTTKDSNYILIQTNRPLTKNIKQELT